MNESFFDVHDFVMNRNWNRNPNILISFFSLVRREMLGQFLVNYRHAPLVPMYFPMKSNLGSGLLANSLWYFWKFTFPFNQIECSTPSIDPFGNDFFHIIIFRFRGRHHVTRARELIFQFKDIWEWSIEKLFSPEIWKTKIDYCLCKCTNWLSSHSDHSWQRTNGERLAQKRGTSKRR